MTDRTGTPILHLAAVALALRPQADAVFAADPTLQGIQLECSFDSETDDDTSFLPLKITFVGAPEAVLDHVPAVRQLERIGRCGVVAGQLITTHYGEAEIRYGRDHTRIAFEGPFRMGAGWATQATMATLTLAVGRAPRLTAHRRLELRSRPEAMAALFEELLASELDFDDVDLAKLPVPTGILLPGEDDHPGGQGAQLLFTLPLAELVRYQPDSLKLETPHRTTPPAHGADACG